MQHHSAIKKNKLLIQPTNLMGFKADTRAMGSYAEELGNLASPRK